jgi:pullulanase/glycogen debranching enzyme
VQPPERLETNRRDARGYQARGLLPITGINFIIAHEVVTLNDLVNHDYKHNEKVVRNPTEVRRRSAGDELPGRRW